MRSRCRRTAKNAERFSENMQSHRGIDWDWEAVCSCKCMQLVQFCYCFSILERQLTFFLGICYENAYKRLNGTQFELLAIFLICFWPALMFISFSAAYCYRRCVVCLCVCSWKLWALQNRIEVPFVVWTYGGLKTMNGMRVPDPHGKGHFGVESLGC